MNPQQEIAIQMAEVVAKVSQQLLSMVKVLNGPTWGETEKHIDAFPITSQNLQTVLDTLVNHGLLTLENGKYTITETGILMLKCGSTRAVICAGNTRFSEEAIDLLLKTRS